MTLELGSIDGLTLTISVFDPLFPGPFNVGLELGRKSLTFIKLFIGLCKLDFQNLLLKKKQYKNTYYYVILSHYLKYHFSISAPPH